MVWQKVKNRLKREETKQEDELNLTKEDQLFLISLYPKGRSASASHRQLQEKYPDTSESVIKRKMKDWISKMKSYGIISIINTQDVGSVLTLTKKGENYVRQSIKIMHKKELEMFVKIINRLLKVPDDWAVNYYYSQARRIISRNLPLFTVIFDFKPMDRVINDLNDPFGIKFDEKRYHNFQDAIDKMELLGLVRVEYEGGKVYMGATDISRDIIAEITKGQNTKGRSGNLDVKFLKNQKDIILLISVILSMLVSFAIIALYFPINPDTGLLTANVHYGIYTLAMLPLLVTLFYVSISKLYRYAQMTKK